VCGWAKKKKPGEQFGGIPLKAQCGSIKGNNWKVNWPEKFGGENQKRKNHKEGNVNSKGKREGIAKKKRGGGKGVKNYLSIEKRSAEK